MGTGGVRKVFRRRQGKSRGTNPLLREIVADKIGELLVDRDDFVCSAGQRSQHMYCRRVARQEHPVTIAAADNGAGCHPVGGHTRLEVFRVTPATRTVPTNCSPGFVVLEMMFSHVPSSRIVNDLCVIGRMWDVLERV
jgi:hypothetical protein